MDIQSIAKKWEADELLYKELGKIVSSFIKSNISECEILPEVSHRTKELLSIVKKIKKKQRVKDYSYEHLNDKLGIRIICTFTDEMGKIDDFLHKYFDIKKVERKQETLDFDRLDYISNHYDACINLGLNPFSKYDHLRSLVFEIQVRTLNQHAWSNTAHMLSYKQEAEISATLKRKIYRLLSLYEIADDEFAIVNKALLNHPDNLVYTLLRKLESKIYKYAQIDFDRESSLYVIRTILEFMSQEEKQTVSSGIEDFIKLNEDKIIRIFEENRSRYFEVPFLTQPEIFLVWFGLENFSFTIENNWTSEFDSFELEQVRTLWGTLID